jgi:hypothetical protein
MRHRPKIRPPIPPNALPLLYCLAAAAGCDSRQLLAPPTRTAAPSTLDASSDASVIGAATVAPEQTGGVSIGAVPESTWVVIQVSGEYDAKPNPACAAQPPNWPCIFNPPGSNFYDPAPFTSGPVQAWVTTATRTSQVQLRGTGGAVNTAGQAVGLYFGTAPGELVVRSALQNFGTQNPNPVGQVSSWIFSGGYHATATTIHPLTFSGGPTGAPQGTATFTVGTTAPLQFINPIGFGANAPPGNVDWYFVPGDSVPLEYERTSQAWQVFACYRQTTCTVIPPPNLNGRMQVEAYVEGKLVIGRSDYVRNTCQSGSGASNCGHSGPKLNVSCVPASPVRGDTISCNSTVTPAQQFTVLRRVAQGRGFTVIDSTQNTYASGGTDVWRGPAIAKTRVTVVARVAGASDSLVDRAEFEPKARQWPVYEITSPQVDTVVDARSMTVPPRDSTALGAFYLYGLDIRRTPVFRATTGPNATLAMLAARPEYLNSHIAHIFLHPALFTPSTNPLNQAWYNDQNGDPTGTCGQNKMPRLRIEAERHEGATVSTDSHVGIANESFRSEKPQEKMEELYVQAAPDSILQFGAFAKYNDWYTHKYFPAQTVYDQAQYPLIYGTILGCGMDNNPSNP